MLPSPLLPLLLVLARPLAPQAPELSFPRLPALSPDARHVAFSHQGDVWVAALDGGPARRLTAHDAYDTSPQWSPDGSHLAFTSTRHGNADVFYLPAAGGEPRRVTWHSESEALYGWIDAERLLIGATRDRNYTRRGRGAWIAFRDGRTPEILMDAAAQRPAISQGGRWICYERGHGDPRRRGYRGSASSALWVYDTIEKKHRELTTFDGNDLHPMWGGEGRGEIFFLSDRACPGNEKGRELGLWKISVNGGEPALVFHPGARSLRYPSISRDGRKVVAELDAHLVLIDTESGAAQEFRVHGSFDPSEPVEYESVVTSGASSLAVSPDGESIAFVAQGDVYVLRKHEKIARAARVTAAPELDDNPVWVDGGKALLFVSERDGNGEVYRVRPAQDGEPFYKSRAFVEERLTRSECDEFGLAVAPDGKKLAWIQGPGTLVVGDPATLQVKRVVAVGFEAPDYEWSPDSAWLAYSQTDNNYNTEVYLARAETEGLAPDAPGVRPFNLTRHPDDDVGPRWSPDGRKLVFTSRRQILDETDVWVAWLVKGDPEMNERERLEAEEARQKAEKDKKKKKPEPAAAGTAAGAPAPAKEGAGQEPPAAQEPGGDKPAAGQKEGEEKEEEKKVEPVRIDFEGLTERLQQVTRREGNETVLGSDADSEHLYFNASVGTRLAVGTEGERGFFKVNLYDGKEEKLEPAPVSSFTRHDKEIFYVKEGKIVGRAAKAQPYDFRVAYRQNRRVLRRAVMEQAWRVLDRGFYDPGFHGHDWAASLAKWLPIATSASTGEDFAEAVNWMLGEMNASHMGYSGAGQTEPKEVDRNVTGELGVLWDESYEGPGRRVAEVLKDTPAHREASRLQPGDVVLAVNGDDYEAGDNWHRLMLGTAGEETLLQVRNSQGEEREVLIRPMSYSALGGALYRRQMERARAQVERDSGGRLGYIHIEAMGTGSLLEFERDLFHAGDGKDALLIDVRENGGGWTTDMVLAMLMVKDHAITVPRGGGPGYPQERRIFATWNKPVVVLCNENSYSNAEIFSWSIRTLKRGPIVGKQTYGAVISTGGAGLLDGSFVRLPLRGWYVNDGSMTNMELNGCPPDYPVENLPGDYAAGKDRQLEKAIEVGLEQLRK